MKKILSLIVMLVLSVNCKAQPIQDISAQGWQNTSGVYYKDINNNLDAFEGTYLYTDGDDSFRIVFQKKSNVSVANRYTEDLIIGEYRFVLDGIEKVNTLSDINASLPKESMHRIDGNHVLVGTERGCTDCSTNEKRLLLSITDPTTESVGQLFVRRITVSGQDAIKIFVQWNSKYRHVSEPATVPPSFGGEYILIKQP
ncbi:MAG TPA: DUF6705 family protein [Flavobacterium sp.]|jgi:hypothetical protein